MYKLICSKIIKNIAKLTNFAINNNNYEWTWIGIPTKSNKKYIIKLSIYYQKIKQIGYKIRY